MNACRRSGSARPSSFLAFFHDSLRRCRTARIVSRQHLSPKRSRTQGRGGARSSAGLDQPLRGVGWPPCAGRRRPPRRVRLRGAGKKARSAKFAVCYAVRARGAACGRCGMARRSARAWPDREHVLVPERTSFPACDGFMRVRYENRRRLETLSGSVRLRLKVRRCEREDCARRHKPYRPEAEGAIALPQHEFGLDVIALVGALRHREHRSIPEIHAVLRGREVEVCERSVTNLLDRYDELLAVSLTDSGRLRGLLAGQGRVILAIDGLQPDVGHEVLWVVRDCLSGEVLLARSLLSGTAADLAPLLREVGDAAADLAPLLREVGDAAGVPVAGVVSDGQTSIRRAVERALPGVPHQLCHFHFLREAALPVFEADRHAKVALKKHVRGVRPIERAAEGRDDAKAERGGGYCAAVRGATPDEGRPPLAASGLRLKARLEKVAASLDRLAQKGAVRRGSRGCAD